MHCNEDRKTKAGTPTDVIEKWTAVDLVACLEPAYPREAETSSGEVSVIVSAVTVDLAANLAAGPPGTVNIDVSASRANGVDQFIKFPSANTSLVCQVGDIDSGDRAGDCGWWRRARLRANGTVSEIRA